MKRPLCPVEILNRLADDSSYTPAFWILTSAAAHLNGYNLNDGEPSSVAVYVATVFKAAGQCVAAVLVVAPVLIVLLFGGEN